MKRLTMTAVAALTLALPPTVAHAQNPPKPPGAEAPGGGGEPAEGAKPGAPGRAGAPGGAPGQRRPGAGEGDGVGEGRPGRPAQGEQPGEPKPGQARPDQPKPGQARPDQPRAGEAQPEPARPGAAAPGRPGGTGRPAAARPAPHVAAAQRQQVVTRFRTIEVAPVHVDFDVRVGIAVPRTVVLQPVPREIIEVVPEFEGFRFFVVPGEIVIVDPDTLEVVEVLPL